MIAAKNLDAIARESRLKVLDLLYAAQTSHIGSLLGAAEIFAAVFSEIDLDEDTVVLSAGWKAALLYFHLWKHGRITLEELDSYCMPGSKWIGLAEPIHPDIKIAGGSMQMGFPGAVGIALAKKLKEEVGQVFCIMSDGEMAGGMVHESALIAAHHNLDNLTVIVDRNGFQAMGETNKILNIEPLQALWAVWGWETSVVDGHSTYALDRALDRDHIFMPMIIIADTVKGKGWKRAENNNLYHYKGLSKEEYFEARKEIFDTP